MILNAKQYPDLDLGISYFFFRENIFVYENIYDALIYGFQEQIYDICVKMCEVKVLAWKTNDGT